MPGPAGNETFRDPLRSQWKAIARDMRAISAGTGGSAREWLNLATPERANSGSWADFALNVRGVQNASFTAFLRAADPTSLFNDRIVGKELFGDAPRFDERATALANAGAVHLLALHLSKFYIPLVMQVTISRILGGIWGSGLTHPTFVALRDQPSGGARENERFVATVVSHLRNGGYDRFKLGCGNLLDILARSTSGRGSEPHPDLFLSNGSYLVFNCRSPQFFVYFNNNRFELTQGAAAMEDNRRHQRLDFTVAWDSESNTLMQFGMYRSQDALLLGTTLVTDQDDDGVSGSSWVGFPTNPKLSENQGLLNSVLVRGVGDFDARCRGGQRRSFVTLALSCRFAETVKTAVGFDLFKLQFDATKRIETDALAMDNFVGNNNWIRSSRRKSVIEQMWYLDYMPSPVGVGRTVALYSPAHGRFVRMNGEYAMDSSAAPGGDLPADRSWELFTVVDSGDGEVLLHSAAHGRFVYAKADGTAGASAPWPCEAPPADWTGERLRLIDVGGGCWGLYNATLRRFLRLNSAGVVDLSIPCTPSLPGDWAWERFVVIPIA
jgi:hypothetical protein